MVPYAVRDPLKAALPSENGAAGLPKYANGPDGNYLTAIINSGKLSRAVTQPIPKSQFGARDLHKHLWKLSIPEFDAGNSLHVRVSRFYQDKIAECDREIEANHAKVRRTVLR